MEWITIYELPKAFMDLIQSGNITLGIIATAVTVIAVCQVIRIIPDVMRLWMEYKMKKEGKQ